MGKLSGVRVEYCEIALTQGKVALVDASDYERLKGYKWQARLYPKSGKWYAYRNLPTRGSAATRKCLKLPMAREIMGLTGGDPRRVDHRNTEATLDNRRSNLRIATQSQNGMNSKRRCDNQSGFKGVFRDSRPKSERYSAKWVVNGKQFTKGGFLTKETAAEYRAKMISIHHGEFANNG